MVQPVIPQNSLRICWTWGSFAIAGVHSKTVIGLWKSHEALNAWNNDCDLGSMRPRRSPATEKGWQLIPANVTDWLAPLDSASWITALSPQSPTKKWASAPWRFLNNVSHFGFWSTPKTTGTPNWGAVHEKPPIPQQSSVTLKIVSAKQGRIRCAKDCSPNSMTHVGKTSMTLAFRKTHRSELGVGRLPLTMTLRTLLSIVLITMEAGPCTNVWSTTEMESPCCSLSQIGKISIARNPQGRPGQLY